MIEKIDYAGVLRRNWKVALAVFVAALIATVIVTVAQKSMYESVAQVIVAPSPATANTADVIRSLETLERRTVVATFARMSVTDEAKQQIVGLLQLPPDRAEEFTLHATVVPNTNIIRIDAQGPDAELAAAMANRAAGLMATRAQSLYRVYSLQFLSRATVPEKPAYPDRKRNLLVGAMIGVFLAAAAALSADRVRPLVMRLAA